jgi:predicted phosphoribosyltransferase
VLAAPVCAPRTADRLSEEADEVVCLETPAGFAAVGSWYRDFSPTPDETVVDLLARARGPAGAGAAEDGGG